MLESRLFETITIEEDERFIEIFSCYFLDFIDSVSACIRDLVDPWFIFTLMDHALVFDGSCNL